AATATAQTSCNSMVATTERINAWLSMAAENISESNWELAGSHSGAHLFHRPGPRGHLVKFVFRNLSLCDTPENSSDVMVRPEVSGQMHDRYMDGMSVRWIKTFAPGDSLVEQSSSHVFHRTLALLFGDFVGPSLNDFLYSNKPVLARHQCRKNFPEKGDSTYAIFLENEGFESMMIWRKEDDGETFQVVHVYSTPMDAWATWASPFFRMMAQTAYGAIQYYKDRPGLKQMRVVDENFYIILALQNFRRGPPLLPAKPDEPDVITIYNERFGSSTWKRYGFSSKELRCAEYLRELTAELGLEMETFDQLDGRPLVPYQ
ncbi:Voltage-dependent T-type calcium channel subunit alpha-1H, partial [Durusdinium trenchii]